MEAGCRVVKELVKSIVVFSKWRSNMLPAELAHFREQGINVPCSIFPSAGLCIVINCSERQCRCLGLMYSAL